MKKKILVLMMCGLVSLATACGGGSTKKDASKESTTKTEKAVKPEKEKPQEVTIKRSPDKYTWYLKNYVGKNLASMGYASLGGYRLDTYGDGYIKLIPVTEDGTYIDVENEDDLKQYVITGQGSAPNTEIKYVYDKDEDGNEMDGIVKWQNLSEIVLSVSKVGSNNDMKLTEIKPADNENTFYIRDYTGRSAKYCGYLTLGGDIRDNYGYATVKMIYVTEDGSYIDPNDEESLAKYVVTGQNIGPNTALTYDIGEYDTAENQNIDEIELSVSPIE